MFLIVNSLDLASIKTEINKPILKIHREKIPSFCKKTSRLLYTKG